MCLFLETGSQAGNMYLSTPVALTAVCPFLGGESVVIDSLFD